MPPAGTAERPTTTELAPPHRTTASSDERGDERRHARPSSVAAMSDVDHGAVYRGARLPMTEFGRGLPSKTLDAVVPTTPV
jgi:hypothetical protein